MRIGPLAPVSVLLRELDNCTSSGYTNRFSLQQRNAVGQEKSVYVPLWLFPGTTLHSVHFDQS
jgi:hypothetical protein